MSLGSPLVPPMIRPAVPPGATPEKPLSTYESLIEKPSTLEEAGVTGTGSAPLTGPLTLHALGVSPLSLQRDEGVAGVLPVIEIKRDGTTLGYIGIDASDRLVLLKNDGTTVLFIMDPTGVAIALLGLSAPHLEATTDVKTPLVLDGAGDQVVGTRGAAIANATASGASASGAAGSGASTAGAISHASADPVPKADYDVLVDKVNAIQTAQGTNASAIASLLTTSSAHATAINSIVTTLNAVITAFNTLLARLRPPPGGHGLIG